MKNKFKSLLLKPENYIYLLLAIILFGVYWHETSFNQTLEIVVLFCTSCAIVFFIIELFFTIIHRKAEINNLITRFFLVLIFSILSFVYFDKLYFHSLKLLIIILFIPIIIAYVINKIRIWLDL